MATRKVMLKTAPEDPELTRLLEAARGHVITPEERREQAISFVYGNLMGKHGITKEDVRRLFEEHYGIVCSGDCRK